MPGGVCGFAVAADQRRAGRRREQMAADPALERTLLGHVDQAGVALVEHDRERPALEPLPAEPIVVRPRPRSRVVHRPGRRRTNTVFVSIMTRSAEHTRYVFEPTVTRSKFLKCTPRSALLTALITIVAAMAVTSSASPASSATVSTTVTIRWPSTVGGETAHVFPLRIPIGETISAVRAYFPGGAIAESGGKAYIVDCAHRGPSLAVLSTVSLDGVAWFTIILETGQCTNGPTDRGKRLTIKIEAHER